MSSILRLENIVKTFPGVKALSDMNLTLNRGEIHALVGENGAGKSTLIKVISGVNRPDSGNIYFEDKKIDYYNAQTARSMGIAVVYQETSLFSDLSVMENMFMNHFPRKGFRIDYKEMKQKAEAVFEQLQISIDVTAKISSLGIAMKQMVEIAKAVVLNAKILILDEPTASLTEREVESLFKIVRNVKNQGTAVVYISHRLDEVFELADIVTVIRDGEFVFTKDIQSLDRKTIIAGMVGRSIDSMYPKSNTNIGDVLLKVEHLSQKNVIYDVSFEVRKGEILGVSGLAGSGRTELAMILAGFRMKDSGTMLLEGQEYKVRNYREALSQGVVYVSEDRGKYGLELPMSIRENVSLPVIAGISKYSFVNAAKDREMAQDFIGQLRIKAPNEEFIVENLSGGNQQKVSVAKALACKPKLLILDEPTRGVDVGAKAEIHRIISHLADRGMAIIMISSELPELIGMSDRIVVMRRGSLVGEVQREDFSQEKIMTIALDERQRGEGNE